MLSSIKHYRDGRDEGFTLIELMVVVLIIAILLAIAIPTFLGARNTANARAAQSNLRNALTAEQTQWTNSQAFSTDPVAMGKIEASLTWQTAASTTAKQIDVAGSDPATASGTDYQVVVMSSLGKDGNCWSIAQINDPNPTAGTVGPDGTYYQKTTGTCTPPAAPKVAATAGSAATGTAAGWYTSF